jgi:hypothetical protein
MNNLTKSTDLYNGHVRKCENYWRILDSAYLFIIQQSNECEKIYVISYIDNLTLTLK